MTLDDLTHSYTPKELDNVNQSIIELLKTQPDIDISVLNTLLHERDSVIKAYLETLDDVSKREFANAEIVVNELLSDTAKQWLSEAKNDITRFVRSQVAIKKYK